MSEKVDIVEVSPIKRNRPKVVTGFAGAGFVGNTALMHIVRDRGFKLKAQLRSHLIPAMILLEDGRPTHPLRIYGDDEGELLFAVSAVLLSPENVWPIGFKLMEYFRKLGVSEFIAVEGMPLAVQAGKRPIFSFGVPEKDLSQYGVSSIREGGVSGLNAVLFDESMKRGLPWVALLVPTPFASAIDYGGVIPVVEILDKMFGLGVDMGLLERRAEMIRKAAERGRRGERGGGLFGFLRRPTNLEASGS